MLDNTWSSLGGFMGIANTSGAVWLLMLDISERPSEEGDNPQDLSLLCLGNT